MVRRTVAASLRFRVLVVVAAAGLIIAGVGQLRNMHADVLPETAPTTVEVQTEALGLSGPEVESLITVPMEVNLFDGVMGVTSVTSDSVPGLSSIDLHFQPGFDLLHARQLVQERLTQAFALPNVSKPPVMLQPVSSSSRVMMIGLTSTELSPIELSVLARWTIVPRLLGLAGVANVSTFGEADRQLQVQVDPARLAARRVTLAQIIETAGNSQLVSPLTYLQASTPGTGGFLEGPNQRITVRHLLPFGTPADLAQVPVAGVGGVPVRLGSVTNVVEDHQPLIGSALVGGRAGLVLVVQKLRAASVLAVTREVDRALAELRPALAGVVIDASLFRAADYVNASKRQVLTGLVIAAAFATLALIALFVRIRLAFIAVVAIGLSLLAATSALALLGYTFNALVALGLLLAVGAVVDDAVGSLRDRRSPAYAELRGAAVYATLAVLLILAPVFLATGTTARFLHPMLLAMGLAVIASMVVALTVTPALDALLPAWSGWSPTVALRARARAAYRRALAPALRAPRILLLAICALGLAGVALLPWLRAPTPPAFRDRSLVVHWTGPPGMSLQELDRITARAAGELRALPAVAEVGANLGRALTADQVVNTNSGEIWVTIRPNADYSRTVAAVRAIVAGTPGMHARLGTYEADNTPGVLAPAARTVVARVYGNDYAVLARLGDEVRAAMAGIHGLGHPVLALPTQQPTLAVEVNVARAEQVGVKPGDVRREASTLLSGLTVGNFFESQKVFDVVVVGTPAARTSASTARNLLLDTIAGGHVRLGDIASVSLGPSPADIQHEAISRYVDVSAPVSAGAIASATSAVTGALRAISFPLEYHAEVQPVDGQVQAVDGQGQPVDGQVQPLRRDPGTPHPQLLGYALAAIVGILLLAHAALGAWAWALVVLLLMPVSLAGGLLVAVATGTTGTLAADAGLLAVLAIAQRQTLTVAGRIRRLHAEQGGPLQVDTVARAAADGAGRAVAAAIVVAAALVPFAAAGNVAGSELLHVAAAVTLGGLVTATPLALFVLPALCLRLGSSAPMPASEPLDDLDWAAQPLEPQVEEVQT